MGRSACCSKVGLRRGPWSSKEDSILASYIQLQGEGQWRSLPSKAGLLRCGKSCRLRWMNYLRPGIKRGNISQDEEDLIVRLHRLLGNRWSLIAGRLPGRTDNEIKNYWNTHLFKKLHTTSAAPRNKNKSAATPELVKMAKVYSPKPIRVSSAFNRANSCDSLASGSSSSDGAAEAVVSAWPPLPELEEPAALYHFSDSVPGDVSMWEEVFEEYLKLL